MNQELRARQSAQSAGSPRGKSADKTTSTGDTLEAGLTQVVCFDVANWDADHLRAAWRDDPSTEVRFVSAPLHEHPEMAREAEIVSVFIHSRIDDDTLKKLPSLRLVATRSTGLHHIDFEACASRGVAVTYVPSYCESTVAEHTFCLILSLTRRLLPSASRGRRGNFDLHGMQGIDLDGKVLGIVGMGRIGKRVARLGNAFGLKVLAYDPNPADPKEEGIDVEFVPLEQLLESSDVITLHAPEKEDTYHMIDTRALAQMKPDAILINTARGSLIDTTALAAALDEKHIGGAALDVLDGEHEVLEDQALLGRGSGENVRAALGRELLTGRDNVILTPHNAFNSSEAIARVARTTVKNINAWQRGKPTNLLLHGTK